jgi:pantoate--beta-alanine ligase
MGALHAGHAALIDAARRECGVVVVSIFVNPIQFNSQEDLARYPRTLDADAALCREHGADILFVPSAAEVYPEPPECTVDVGRLGDHLCGKFRPGHFRGVATVVLKLFQMVQPHRAYFGEKDAQQLAIVRRLVADFNIPIAVAEVPTVREADGLAMSSRNRHLLAGERRQAVSLYQALLEAKRRISSGDRNAAAIKQAAAATIPQSETLKIEYLEIVDPITMQPVEEVDRPVRVAGAIWVGSTRLIDNVLVKR